MWVKCYQIGREVRFKGISLDPGVRLEVSGGSGDLNLTNLTLGDGSTFAADDRDTTLTVSGRLDNGITGVGSLGGSGEFFNVNLTVADSAEFDWTLDGNDVDGHYIHVWGDVDLGECTINVLYGGSVADGEDAWLIVADSITPTDLGAITVNLPHRWTTGDPALAIEAGLVPGADVLVLKNLVAVVPGDTDDDSDVDGGDYDNLLAQFGGPPVEPDSADLNVDDAVDIEDFAILREYYGTAALSPQGGAATPEPTTLLLLATGIPILVKRRKTNGYHKDH